MMKIAIITVHFTLPRILIPSLFLSFPSLARPSERSHDVLNLIGKILSFSDEQLKIVGLKDRPMSMLDSLLSSVLPFAPEVLQLSSNV
jgi:hypothetical protein